MKPFRKRITWILLALFLLSVLASAVWYGRQVRQQHLDRALIAAIKKNDTPAAIDLLDVGADANAVDKPENPITLKSLLADFWNRMKGNKPPKDDTGEYPSALLLLTGGFRTNVPLNNPELVKALLEHGGNPNTFDIQGLPALCYTAYWNHTVSTRLLLEHHANPNQCDSWKGSAMHWVSNEDCARLLVEYGADVNAQNEYGDTALITHTREHPSLSIVRFLLRRGAKVSIRNERDDTALSLARQYEFKDMIPLLEAAMKKEQAERKSSAKTDRGR